MSPRPLLPQSGQSHDHTGKQNPETTVGHRLIEVDVQAIRDVAGVLPRDRRRGAAFGAVAEWLMAGSAEPAVVR